MIWWRFSSLVLSMKKTFSKSFLIPPLELTLDNIVLNYCLLDSVCFTYAEDSFLRITSWRDRKLACSKHHCTTEPMSLKVCQQPLWVGDSVKLSSMAELSLRNHCWRIKTMSKSSSELRHTKIEQQRRGRKSFELMNQCSKYFGQIGGSICGEELVKELQPYVLQQT